MNNNYLHAIEYYKFANLKELGHLDLSSNKILNIDLLAFSKLKKLKEVNLKYIPISALFPSIASNVCFNSPLCIVVY